MRDNGNKMSMFSALLELARAEEAGPEESYSELTLIAREILEHSS